MPAPAWASLSLAEAACLLDVVRVRQRRFHAEPRARFKEILVRDPGPLARHERVHLKDVLARVAVAILERADDLMVLTAGRAKRSHTHAGHYSAQVPTRHQPMRRRAQTERWKEEAAPSGLFRRATREREGREGRDRERDRGCDQLAADVEAAASALSPDLMRMP